MAGEKIYGNQPPLAVTPTLTHIQHLQRERKYRDKHGLFFVEGVRNFVAAVNSDCIVDTLVYSERLLVQPLARQLIRRLKRANVPYVRLSPEEFRTISHTERASGVAAILRQPTLKLSQIAPVKYPCWVVLEQVRTPGNFGTLLRTAAAVGAGGFILLGYKTDPYNPVVVRASMGALFGQKIVRTTSRQLSRWVQQHQLLVVGASPDGTIAYNEMHYQRPTLLMLGEERGGLTEEQRRLCQQLVSIPMTATTDSLNLGVAGSLLMYEVVRDTNTLVVSS